MQKTLTSDKKHENNYLKFQQFSKNFEKTNYSLEFNIKKFNEKFIKSWLIASFTDFCGRILNTLLNTVEIDFQGFKDSIRVMVIKA